MSKLLRLYHKWEKLGYLTHRDSDKAGRGLCNCLPKKYKKDLYSLFYPTSEDRQEIFLENVPIVYWGYGESRKKYDNVRSVGSRFTPFRQNIVLLICAMHNEL